MYADAETSPLEDGLAWPQIATQLRQVSRPSATADRAACVTADRASMWKQTWQPVRCVMLLQSAASKASSHSLNVLRLVLQNVQCDFNAQCPWQRLTLCHCAVLACIIHLTNK